MLRSLKLDFGYEKGGSDFREANIVGVDHAVIGARVPKARMSDFWRHGSDPSICT